MDTNLDLKIKGGIPYSVGGNIADAVTAATVIITAKPPSDDYIFIVDKINFTMYVEAGASDWELKLLTPDNDIAFYTAPANDDGKSFVGLADVAPPGLKTTNGIAYSGSIDVGRTVTTYYEKSGTTSATTAATGGDGAWTVTAVGQTIDANGDVPTSIHFTGYLLPKDKEGVNIYEVTNYY